MIKVFKNLLNSSKNNILYVKVRAIPKSSKTEFIDQMDDKSWKIRVKAVPEKGKANKEIINFFKKTFLINNIEIISGKNDRVKLIKITK